MPRFCFLQIITVVKILAMKINVYMHEILYMYGRTCLVACLVRWCLQLCMTEAVPKMANLYLNMDLLYSIMLTTA